MNAIASGYIETNPPQAAGGAAAFLTLLALHCGHDAPIAVGGKWLAR